MLWVDYTCLILFFGAKLCNVLAHFKGHPIKPSEHAEWTAEYIISQQQKEEY
jgi:membrane protein